VPLWLFIPVYPGWGISKIQFWYGKVTRGNQSPHPTSIPLYIKIPLRVYLHHFFKKAIGTPHITFHIIMAVFVFPAVGELPIDKIAEHRIEAFIIG
jgi:hypothetical protein